MLVLFSCKKSAPVSYPSGPIEVYVKLYDELGIQVSGAGGVTVSIIDTINNSSALNPVNPPFQTNTDASGKCNFSSVPAGTYTFVFQKSKYGTVVQYNTLFTPETAPYILSANMAKVSSVDVSNLNFDTVSGALWLTCNIDTVLSPYSSVRFFWGTDSTLTDSNNYVQMVLCNTLQNYNVLNTSGLIGFTFSPTSYSRDSLGKNVLIHHGAKIYAIAYGEVNAPTVYTDIDYSIRQLQYTNGTKKYPSGITKYPNLNTTPSKKTSIIVP